MQKQPIEKPEIFYSFPAEVLPQITNANTVTIDLPYVHYKRTPTEYILYVITEGIMYLTEGDVEYNLTPGDIILLDPSRCHYGRESSRCTYYYFHFRCPAIQEITMTNKEYQQTLRNRRILSTSTNEADSLENPPLILPKYFHLNERPFHNLETHAVSIKLNFHDPLEGHQQLASSTLIIFLTMLERTLTDLALENETSKELISFQIIAYLKIYYYEHLSSQDIAHHFHGNFDYLNRKFKLTIGKTIFQWLNEYRITVAKYLLQTGYYTNGQIASRTGFNNEFYFSKVFKKITGMTPTEYKSHTEQTNIPRSFFIP